MSDVMMPDLFFAVEKTEVFKNFGFLCFLYSCCNIDAYLK